MEYFPWSIAEVRAVAGERVRLADWHDRWLRFADGLWWLDIDMVNSRVVEAGDFGLSEFRRRDWTVEPYALPDVCARPPAAQPPYTPPAIGVTARLNASETLLQISASIGAGSREGAYWMMIYVNGVYVARESATEPRLVEKSIVVQDVWLDGDISVKLEVRSSLPLPRWVGEETYLIARCPIGVRHSPGSYMGAFSFPGTNAGTLPVGVPGTSLSGITAVNGSGNSLQSIDGSLRCDFPAYTNPGAPYGYDGIIFHVTGVVRENFDFQYEYCYSATSSALTGAKNVVTLSGSVSR